MVSLMAENGGIAVLGSRGQVLHEGNSEDLLDDVGNFPKDWFSA